MTLRSTRRKPQLVNGDHALRQGELSPGCLTFDLTVMHAIGGVARAAHNGSPTRELISKACEAFANYAAQHEAAQP
jgi:hypothetical protein